MKQFNQLRTNMVDRSAVLAESLDTAVDFYMTDDTKIPTQIFSAFELDGTQYGASLEESNFSKVYILRVYRIVNAKVRLWSFIKPTHFRPAIATTLKFIEASIPFLHTKMDGIIIQIPGKLQPDKINRLLDFIVKKSFTKTFRSVKVMSNNKEQAYNYAFIVRKTIAPAALFSSKSFSKYSFDDVKPNEMPVAAAEAMQTKMKFQKTMVKTEPSKKYSFKGMTIKNPTAETNEVIAKIINLEPKIALIPQESAGKPDIHALVPIKKEEEKKEEEKKAEEIAPAVKLLPFPPTPNYLDNDEMAHALILVMPNATAKIKESGFNASKFKPEFFANILNKDNDNFSGNIALAHRYLQKIFIKQGWMSGGELTVTGIAKAKVLLMCVETIVKAIPGGNVAAMAAQGFHNGMNKLKAWGEYHAIEDKNEEILNPKPKKTVYSWDTPPDSITSSGMTYTAKSPKQSFIDEAIDFSLLKSDLPGADDFVFSDNTDYGVEPGENKEKKETHIIEQLGYGGFGTKSIKTKGVKSGSYSAIKSYTGSGSSSMNSNLRSVFNDLVITDKELKTGAGNTDILKRIKQMYKGFQDIKPFPINMWIYRGATMPSVMKASDLYPGKTYVDPGFMSCAIYSDNTFGMGNIKHRIFIPKGSKIIPILQESSHSNEREVILPPSSVLKIIRFDEIKTSVYDDPIYIVTSIYTGHVFEDLLEKYESVAGKIKDEEDMNEAKKPTVTVKDPKYDPNKKFGGTANPKYSKKIAEMIKNGDLKVTK